mgnify:CR=1 FL=1
MIPGPGLAQRKGNNVDAQPATNDGTASESGAKQPVKDIVRREETLFDKILTFLFLAEVGGVFYFVRNDMFSLAFLLGSLVGVFVLINVAKLAARNFGTFLSDIVLNTWWTPEKQRRPLQKKQTMKKFTDQAWQVSCAIAVVGQRVERRQTCA